MKVKAIDTEAKSYDVLVGTAVLYPMGFVLDFWEETASYRPGWQAGDGRRALLPARFIQAVNGNLANVCVFSGYMDIYPPWFQEDMDEIVIFDHTHGILEAHMGSSSVEEAGEYRPGVEAAWSTTHQLQASAEQIIADA